MSILQTVELKKNYSTEPNITRALDGGTLSIEKGGLVAIVLADDESNQSEISSNTSNDYSQQRDCPAC